MAGDSASNDDQHPGPDPHRVDARERGLNAEARVAEVLRERGWQVVAQNWRGGGGELDLVVRMGDMVRFVEVKHRTDVEAEPVRPAQVRRLRSAARAWMTAQQVEDWQEACFWLAEVDGHAEMQWTLDPF